MMVELRYILKFTLLEFTKICYLSFIEHAT